MIRPWYRSRLFWLGVPGLVFLVWAWLALPYGIANVIWRGSNRHVVVADSTGYLHVGYVDFGNKAVSSKGKPGFSFYHGSLESGTRLKLFPKAIGLSFANMPDRSGFNFVVAYWFLLLLYLIGWVSWICFRQRRKARLVRHSAAELFPDSSAPQRGEMK